MLASVLAALLLAAPPASREAGRDQSLLNFLNQTLGWYRQQGALALSASDPADLVAVAEQRRLGREAVSLAFEFARASVALQPQQAAVQKAAGSSPNTQAIARLTADAESRVQQLKGEIVQLQSELDQAKGAQKTDLVQRLAETRSELDLALARQGTVQAFTEFMRQGAAAAGGGLLAQIEELRRSVPETAVTDEARKASAPVAAPAAAAEVRRPAPTGVLALASDLIMLSRKKRTVRDGIALTAQLLAALGKLREPLLADTTQTLQQGDVLAQAADSSTGATLQQRGREIDQLTARYKAQSAAIVPLEKQAVLVETSGADLKEWLATIEAQSGVELRMLLVHLGLLATAIAALLAASEFWRRATFRYVKDLRRRQQSLVLRRVVVASVVGLMVAFSLVTELGSLATFAGFITAGLAVALQNVILSVAAYFFLIGKFGIRVGDRVQITNVTGDVLDIGLVRLHLMELRSDGLPTGRVVVFSNSVLFQPSASFFKQLPGSNFAWHQISLTLSRDTDYRAAEKRLMDALEKVYAGYRDSITQQHAEMTQNLSIEVKEPRPNSQLRLTDQALEMSIRFPVPLERGSAIDDLVTRALLDALEREPKLKLLGSSAPAALPAESRTPG